MRHNLILLPRVGKANPLSGKSETKYQPKKFWEYRNYLILPTSPYKFTWQTLIAIVLLFQLMTFPYRFAFENHSNSFQIADSVIDIIFLLDFIFHFFYSYVDKKQKLVNTFKPILKRYLFGTLLFDFFALYPYYFAQSNTLYALKILRYMRVIDMLSGISMVLDELFLKLKNNMNFALSITRIIR